MSHCRRMGKRQRLSRFVGFSDASLLALIADPDTPPDVRRDAIREAKYRGLRNLQKRNRR